MVTYVAPVEEFLFVLHDFLAIETQSLPGFARLDRETTRSVFEGARKIHESVLLPLNQSADRQGARWEDGQVRAPKGFAAAYQAYCTDGWNRVGIPEELGGLGLPPIVANLLMEMGAACNQAFGMYAGSAHLAQLLALFAAPWVAGKVVPHIVSGRWTATMCLTEPHCGTDLKQIKTKAVAQPDGTYLLSGTKIFISSGDHDLAENIVHVVLAKLPDEAGRYPDDLSAVHCFMVPKFQLDPQTGRMGGANGVTATGIERKMGLKGSATCQMSFEGATAWHMGKPGETGMAPMFHLMNQIRFVVGIGALGIAEAAYQTAVAYARERHAGPSPGARGVTTQPLIAQPDVRRLLLESASFIEGARAASAWGSLLQSIAEHGATGIDRKEARDLLSLVTPVFKAYFSDKAFEACNACMQVFGGHGYIADNGIEQHVRDVRVAQIYEGANGIQAYDLVARRLGIGTDNPAAEIFLARIDAFLAAQAAHAGMAPYMAGLRDALGAARDALAFLGGAAGTQPRIRAAVAYDFLTLFGILVVAYVWAQVARSALDAIARTGAASPLLERKLVLARIWMERQTPLARALQRRMAYGGDSFLALSAEEF